MKDQLTTVLCRVSFTVALLLLGIAVLDLLLRFFGVSIVLYYTPGRFVEFSGIMMIFAIAFLLRQIREALRK